MSIKGIRKAIKLLASLNITSITNYFLLRKWNSINMKHYFLGIIVSGKCLRITIIIYLSSKDKNSVVVLLGCTFILLCKKLWNHKPKNNHVMMTKTNRIVIIQLRHTSWIFLWLLYLISLRWTKVFIKCKDN